MLSRMENTTFDIYECVKNFPNKDLKKLLHCVLATFLDMILKRSYIIKNV